MERYRMILVIAGLLMVLTPAFSNPNQDLHAAVNAGNVEGVKAAIAAGADLATRSSVLDTAAQRGHVEILTLLLDTGVSRSAPGGALLLAVMADQVQTSRILIDRGAIPNDRYRNTLLFRAAEAGKAGTLALLLSEGADLEAKSNGFTPLYMAASNGRLEAVRVLLEGGADPNAPTRGTSALNAARLQGHEAIIALLLEKGAREAE